MRVTNSMMIGTTLADLNRSLSRLQDSQTDLATGKAIRKPSDDPSGARSAMTFRSELRRADQYDRTQNDAQGWLATSDSAIVSSLDLLGRVKELAVRAANTGANDQVARSAIANELGQIRDDLIGLANTEYLGRSVFAGTTDGPAYDPTGVYIGDDVAVLRDVAPGTSMQVNTTGPGVFGDPSAPEGDLFAVLDRMQTAISTGNTADLTTEHGRFDTSRANVAAAAGEVGTRGARLEGIQTRSAAQNESLREALSMIEDVDIAEALISVKSRENAYTAALQAASQVLPPSLLDYMR